MTSTRRPKQSGQQQDNRRTEAPPSEFLGLVLVAVAVALGAILLIKGGGLGFDSDAKNVAIGSKNKNQATTTTTTTPAPVTSVPAAQLKVAVLNGAGKSGFAATGANFLSVAGYPTVTAGNSAAQVQTSSVYFAPGYENDAAAVAKVLSIGEVKAIPETPPLGRSAKDVPEGTAVVVVLGPDVEPIIAASNTTTTAAGAATTAPPTTAAGRTASSTPPTTAKATTTTAKR